MAAVQQPPTPPSPFQRLRTAVQDWFGEPLPQHVGWPQVFGSVVLFLIGVQILTGVLLAVYYSPSADSAYESVRYIEEQVVMGGFLRGMHRWGVNLIIVFVAIHLVQVFVWGAYKRPRRGTWVAGCLLLLTILGFGFTGYLLPWDLKAYFGTEVGTNIAGSTPLVGSSLRELLRGGPGIGPRTLPRFYALHVLLLPALLFIFVIWHLWRVRVYGITPPWTRVGDEGQVPRGRPFFPFQAVRDNLAMFGAFILLIVLAILQSRGTFGPSLGEKADPTNSTYVPRPDWYFLGLQELLRLFPKGFGQIIAASILPGLAVLLFLAVPFLDRNSERRPQRRPLALGLGALAMCTTLFLTVAGHIAVGNEEEAAAQRASENEAKKGTPTSKKMLEPQNQAELAAAGEKLFAELKCSSCHPVVGPPRGGVPTLAWEGSRALRTWLTQYLKAPTRIHWETDLAKQGQRPELRMPNFGLSDHEVDEITAYLMAKKDFDLIPHRPELNQPGNTKTIDTGQRLVLTTYRCIICHRIEEKGNAFGPDLTHVGSRRQPDFMYAIVHNPIRLDPKTAMKNLGLSANEVTAVVQYLRTLK